MSDLVGLNVRNPDFTQTMSNFMGMRQQQLQIAGTAADVQMRQQDAAQRKALAGIDWDKHMSDDGTLDLNSFVKDKGIRQAAGDTYPQLIQAATTIKSQQLDAKSRLIALNNDQLSAYAKMVGGLANDPDVIAGNEKGQAMVKDNFTQFAQIFGMDAAKAIAPVALPLMNNQIPPEKLSKMLQHVQMQAVDTASQLEKIKSQPQFVQAPGGLQAVEANSLAPGGVGNKIGTPIAQGIAPTMMTAPSGQPGTVTNNGRTFTPVGSTAPNPLGHERGTYRTATDDAPPPTAPATVQDNYNKAVTAANDHVQQVRESDEHYRTNVDISNKIRELSRTTATGPAMSWIKSKVGASDFQELGAYLDRQAAQLQTAMNLPHTNQGQEAARDISGNTSYTPKAIQEKNDFNQSLVEGFHAYRKGLERVGGLSGNGSPVAINQFKAAWADNFDPNVFRAKAAYGRGKEEGDAFINTLSPEDAARMLKDKKALEALSQGKLPE